METNTLILLYPTGWQMKLMDIKEVFKSVDK